MNVDTPMKKRGRPKMIKTTPNSADHTVVIGSLKRMRDRESSSDGSNASFDMESNGGTSSAVVPAKRTVRAKSGKWFCIFQSRLFLFSSSHWTF